MQLDEFMAHVETILKSSFPEHEFVLNPEQGTITCGDLQFGLSNLYAECELNSVDMDQLKKIVRETFRKSLALVSSTDALVPQTWEQAKPRLRLQLSTGVITKFNSLAFPFSNDIVIAIVIDSDVGYAYVRQADADRWKLSSIDLYQVAQDNLIAASDNLQMHFVPGPSGLIAIQTSDGYDAARILLPPIRQMMIERLMEDRGEQIFVGIPNRDFLVAWPTDAPEDLNQQMRMTILQDAGKQSHPLTGSPFRVSHEKITPLE